MNQFEFSRAANGHSIALHSHAMRFTSDEEDAKDLVQDTLIKGIRFCSKFNEGTNIRGWLYVIMRNTFINNYRKTQKKQSVIDTEEELSSAQLLKSADRNASVGKFAMDDIQRALHCVPAIYRVPFLRYFEGYKYEEIALEQSIPLGTVKTHIHQGKELTEKVFEAIPSGLRKASFALEQ